MSNDVILRVEGLTTTFQTDRGPLVAVSDLDMTVERGEVFGIVGESGSGKSVTARSIMDLIGQAGSIEAGEIWFNDPDLARAMAEETPEAVDGDFVDLRAVPERVRQALRGTAFSMIFQDPTSSFNPSITVGEQLAEAVEVQRRASANPRSTRARTQSVEYSLVDYALSTAVRSRRFIRQESRDRAVELLRLVGIPDPLERASEYPHEYSGGMLQRAMIAQALAGQPEVLIADEPTTALDVTIQAQILDLLADLQESQDMTIVLITHNLGVVARTCDRVGVMYAGQVVERGSLEDVFDDHVHPYTAGLLGSVPDLEATGDRLQPIPGTVPSLIEGSIPDRCRFADRCPKAMENCLEPPPEFDVDGAPDHSTKCVLAESGFVPERALPSDYFGEEHEHAPDQEPQEAVGDGGSE